MFSLEFSCRARIFRYKTQNLIIMSPFLVNSLGMVEFVGLDTAKAAAAYL